MEKAQFIPSPERTEALAQMLGSELRVLAASPEQSDDITETEAAGFACLWRARADLLARAVSGAKTRPQRRRLDLLSRQLIAAASASPKTQAFLHEGHLASLADISERTPRLIRRMVAVEVAAMKLDAPDEINLDREFVLEQLDYVIQDLGDDLGSSEDIHASLSQTLNDPPLRRPQWRDLACTGGPFGTAQAIKHDPEPGLRLLLGHDPVGWFGFQFVAGTWLVRPAALTEAPPVRSTKANRRALQAKPDAWQAKPDLELQMPSLKQTNTAVSVGLIAGSVLLGPVLGTAIGAVLGGMAAGVMTGLASAARADLEDDEDCGTDDEDDDDESGEVDDPDSGASRHRMAEHTLKLAEAFGSRWVRVELTKVLALYRAFPAIALHGDAATQFPTQKRAQRYLTRLALIAENARRREAAACLPTEDFESDRLRELTDIRDSLRQTALALT